MSGRRPWSRLGSSLGLKFLGVAAAAAALGVWLPHPFGSGLAAWMLILALLAVPALWLADRVRRPIRQLLRALTGTVTSYR